MKGEAWSYELVAGTALTVTAKANGAVTLAGKVGSAKVSGSATLQASEDHRTAVARFFSGWFIVEVFYALEDGAVVSVSGRVWRR